jgi:PAS domain S-box-containing protein
MLDVNYRDPQAAGVADLRVALALAAHAAVAIHTAHLAEESALHLRHLDAAQRVSAAVSRAGDLGTVLDVVLAATDELADAPHSMIALLDPDRRYVRGVRGRGLPEGLIEATVRRIYAEPDPDEDILAIVVRTRVQQWFAPDHPARHQPTAQRFSDPGVVHPGTVVTPIAEHDELFGVLTASVSTAREDDAEMLATLRLIAEQAAGAIARERMRDHAFAATRTQALLAAVVTSADDAILSTDLDGRILSWNQAAERLYGYSADEVVGRPIGFVYPPERKAESSAIDRAIAGGEAVTFPDTERVRKDGSIVPVSVTSHRCAARMARCSAPPRRRRVRSGYHRGEASRPRTRGVRAARAPSLPRAARRRRRPRREPCPLTGRHPRRPRLDGDRSRRVQAALETVMQAAMGIGETMRGLLRFVREMPEESRRDVEIEHLLRKVVASPLRAGATRRRRRADGSPWSSTWTGRSWCTRGSTSFGMRS